jgi:dimethylglycine dehydrogenase
MSTTDSHIKPHARVVIIGGGIFGVSAAYHLVKEGWTDIVLIEKGELSSGTTWHAAGQCPHFTGSLNMARIHDYGIQMYKSLEKETGQATGWHTSGGIRLARHKEELDWHWHVAGIAKQAGIETHVVGLEEIRKLHPFLELHDVVGGTYTPHDGHTDPSSANNALAIAARRGGATFYRNTRATNIVREGDEWKIITEKGDIRCEHLVLATGFFSNQVGEWLGLELPFVNVVHQYLVTDPVKELLGRDKELPVVRDPASCSYMRQEQMGLLGGPYENSGLQTAYDEGVPWSFDQELLPPDLDRISPWLELMAERMPLFNTVGVRRVISGFIAHAPDLYPMVGPIAGHRNLWLMAGSAIGISEGPGCGKYLAQWMVHGAADISMHFLDPRRYGPVYTKDWIKARTVEASKKMFDLHPPGYEFHEGRGLRLSPIHDRLAAKGAVFGESMGWERPKWFAPPGVEETSSFSRGNSFPYVAEECRAVRERVGVLDLTSFAKIEVSGPCAEDYLNSTFANKMPRRKGGIALCHILTDSGVTEAEITVTRLADDRFFLLSAGAMQARDLDLLQKALRVGDIVTITDVRADYGCLAVTGPRARELLSRVTEADLSYTAFPWMTARAIDVCGIPTRALRVSYAGELGWELYLAVDRMAQAYDAIMSAGSDLGVRDFGMYALNSLRMEKAYRGFGWELSNELTLLEADMERFIGFDKDNFIGKPALLKRKQEGMRWKLAYMAVDAGHLDVLGSEAVYMNDRIVGVVTSGGYGHATRLNLAFAYVEPELARPGTQLEIEMLGQRYGCEVLPAPAYDPKNERLRS